MNSFFPMSRGDSLFIIVLLAYSPPELITAYYTDAIGVLSAALFVPVVAGLWWKRANLTGGIAAFSAGVVTYVGLINLPGLPKRSPILIALPCSVLAMWIGGRLGNSDEPAMIEAVSRLHQDLRSDSG